MRRDASLVEHILNTRDEDSFRALVERHADAVLRLAASVVRDRQAAEDVAQETFLTVSRKLGRFDTRRSLRAWILGIAYRHALKARRRSAAASRREEQAMTDRKNAADQTRHDPEQNASQREHARVVAEELANLPAAQRVLVTLRYQEGLSYAEAAAATGVREGTARSRVGRALAALRGSLSRRGVVLSTGALTPMLADLSPAHAGTALVDACVAKGVAGLAAPAAVGAVGLKIGIAAAVLATAGAFVGINLRDDDAQRAERRADAARGPAARVLADGGADDAQPQADDRGSAEAESSKKQPETVAGPQPEKEERYITVNGKKIPLSKFLGDKNKLRVGPDGKVRRGPIKINNGGARVSGRGSIGAPGHMDENGNWVWPKTKRFGEPARHYGDARLEGRVVDRAGVPVADAVVYRLTPDTPRDESTIVSGAYTDRVAKTDAAGRFVIEKQKAGRALFMADYRGVMLVPGVGIDTANAASTDLTAGETTRGLVIRVPVVVSDLASLSGVIRDKEGKPVPGAQVWLGRRVRIVSKPDGSFDFGLVPSGVHIVYVEQSGLETHEESFTLAAREKRVLSVEMAYLSEGDKRLAGIVLDDRGLPVPRARVTLTGGSGTIRSQGTDEKGQYAFEKLPAELSELRLSIHVTPPKGYFHAYVKEATFPADHFEIRVDRSVELRVRVTGVDGVPLQSLAYALETRVKRGEKTVWYGARTGSRFIESGVIDDLQFAVGKPLRVKVEAPGHEVYLEELDTAVDVKELEIHVQLRASSTDEPEDTEEQAPQPKPEPREEDDAAADDDET